MKRLVGVGVMWDNSGTMKEKINYPIKRMRMSEKTWELLSSKKKKSGKSWNLFLVDLANNKK